ncbi:MAG: SUMF1/EgtB/PvdO family nonheme iron enzyme [Verrucomicrobiales bacterium]
MSILGGGGAAFAQDLPDQVTNSLGMSFVAVPGTPVLFCQHEARVVDFQKFVDASGYTWAERPHFAQERDHPVVNTSRADALAFCDWLTKKERSEGKLTDQQTYRLPTNEEWDIAAGLWDGASAQTMIERKRLDETMYPWGPEWPPPASAGNLEAGEIQGYTDSFEFTSPAGRFRANAHDLYDMAGNAWEWCYDPQTETGDRGTLRGGSWIYFRPEFLLASYQYSVPAAMRSPTFGFRPVIEDRARRAALMEKRQALNVVSPPRSGDSMRDEEAVASAVKDAQDRILGAGNKDIAKVAPPSAGKPHRNGAGIEFLPLVEGGKVLVARTETSFGLFVQFVNDLKASWSGRPSFRQSQDDAAAGMSWEEAKVFCDWLTKKEREAGNLTETQSYRLPTDAEWSLAIGLADEGGATPAARHLADGTIYLWGSEWPPPADSGNFDSNKLDDYRDRFTYTAPVGSFRANRRGFYDLEGNVSEWVEDSFDAGSRERAIRGGSWLTSDPEQFRASYRKNADQGKGRLDLGFRLALEVE